MNIRKAVRKIDQNLNKNFMKVTIKLHEKETASNYYTEKKVVLFESFECDSAEYYKIWNEFNFTENKKYSKQNFSLDYIQYI